MNLYTCKYLQIKFVYTFQSKDSLDNCMLFHSAYQHLPKLGKGLLLQSYFHQTVSYKSQL